MMIAPLPENETRRLESLHRYGILDSPDEPGFDRLTRLASRLLNMPIALISLVDEKRQWMKSAVGIELRETNRDISFCAHAILQEGVFVVPDATKDPRFADNPLVSGDMSLRFYAGAPISTPDGLGLGTLCVIDQSPRSMGEDEQSILRDLADIAQDEFELRLTSRQRRMQAAAVDNLSSGVLLTDPNLPDNPVVFCNPGFCKMTGYSYEDMVGSNCRFLQGPNTDPKEIARMRQAIANRETYQGELLNYRKDGTPFWVELVISPIFDGDGKLMNFVGLQTDITERRELIEQLQASYERLGELDALRSALG